jgi:VanZ family protein
VSWWRIFCITQFCVLLVVYTYFGLTPHPEQTLQVSFNDKLMHFAGYFFAAFSISFAAPQAALWQRALFLIIYSIAIEIGQHFMPPRTFDLWDIVANGTGIILGLSLIEFTPIKWLVNYLKNKW